MTCFHYITYVLGFAGGEFVALAGRGCAAVVCAPRVAHPGVQHTSSGAAHTPDGNKGRNL